MTNLLGDPPSRATLKPPMRASSTAHANSNHGAVRIPGDGTRQTSMPGQQSVNLLR
jgi:hypothetical protein